MTSYPNNFPNDTNLAYGIVVGGDINDPPSDNSGTLKVLDPLRHGKSVTADQLPFVTMLRTPTMQEQEQTSFPPEPGTVVAYSWTTGEPSGRVVIGQPNERFEGKSSEGNINLSRYHPDILNSFVTDVKKVVSKGFEETTEDGAKVRKPKNGSGWNHNLSEGLPTHAALYPLAGTVVPAIQQIETAVEQFTNNLSNMGNLSLPGSEMGLSDIFSKMTDSQKSSATQNMPPELLKGFNNMLGLLQSGTGGSFPTSGRVDEETVIQNTVELLQQARNMNDIIAALGEIQNNTDLHGLDKLAQAEIEVETPFGKIKKKIDSKGNVSDEVSDVVQKAIQAFSTLISSAGTNSGTTTEKNMFGEHAQTISDMIGRGNLELSKFLNKEVENVATNDLAKYAQSKVKDILGKLGGPVVRG